MTTPQAYLAAQKMLDSFKVQSDGRSCWMSKETYLSLGGTLESWRDIEGDDDAKLLRV